MCGFSGIVYKRKPSRTERDTFRRSSELISHRGPDSRGEWENGNLHLIHYRLRILDTSHTSDQPIVDPNTGSSLVYNGEIYNFRELARMFGLAHDLPSDTLVLQQLLGLNSCKVLPYLNGMFAFAYVDFENGRIVLARDRFGIKPLFLAETNTFTAFSSEAKVLHSLLGELNINPIALKEFLEFGSSISKLSFIKNVERIDPGCFSTIDLVGHGRKTTSYASFFCSSNFKTEAHDNRKIGARRYEDETLEVLRNAVHSQIQADVDIGVFLSGGMDSSCIAALAAGEVSGYLSSFTAIYPNSSVGLVDRQNAQLVAKRFGLKHTEVEILPDNLIEEINEIVFKLDGPIADPAIVPLSCLSKAAFSSGIKVVLQGDGGDEVFAGYGRHAIMNQYRKKRILANFFSIFAPTRRERCYFSSLKKKLNQKSPSRVYAALMKKEYMPWSQFVVPSLDHFNEMEVIERLFKKCERFNASLLKKCLLTDFSSQLCHAFLDKVDRCTMMNSVEGRVPLLDNKVFDYSSQMPQSHLVSGNQTKMVMREVGRKILPFEVVDGKKQYFNSPIGSWLENELKGFIDTIVNEGDFQSGRIIDSSALSNVVDEWRLSHGKTPGWLWRAVTLLIWLRQHPGKVTIENF